MKHNLGNSYLDWNCDGCTVVRDGDSIVVENRFTEHSDFELSTDLYIRESQNVRITIELVDYMADLVNDNSLARTTVEAYIDYRDELHSQKSNIACVNDCVNGVFVGNIDVRNSNLDSDTYKLVVVIHAFLQDKFKVNKVSIGDLVLASEIFQESKGPSHFQMFFFITECDRKLWFRALFVSGTIFFFIILLHIIFLVIFH